MYIKKDGNQHYVYVRDGKPCVSTVKIQGTTALTIYMPDGTLLTNASVTINDTAYTTDADGKVYFTGALGKPTGAFDIVYGEIYMGSAESTTYGTDVSVQLIEMSLLTVTATGFTYSDWFTVTTTIDGVSYVGSLSQYVEVGTQVSIGIVGYDSYPSDGYYYYGSNIVDNGTNTSMTTYSFTMNEEHTITFTNGSRSYQSFGT